MSHLWLLGRRVKETHETQLHQMDLKGTCQENQITINSEINHEMLIKHNTVIIVSHEPHNGKINVFNVVHFMYYHTCTTTCIIMIKIMCFTSNSGVRSDDSMICKGAYMYDSHYQSIHEYPTYPTNP